MKVKLLRDSRINHSAGEIVEVSSAQGAFLLSVGSAAPVVEQATVEVEAVAEKAVKAPKAAAKPATKKKVTKK